MWWKGETFASARLDCVGQRRPASARLESGVSRVALSLSRFRRGGTMLLAVAAQAQQARLTEKKRWRDNARIDDMMPDGAHEATGEVLG